MTILHYLDPNPAGRVPVLLLHGLGANSTSWTLQLPSLIAGGFRPITPDASGFGKSPYDGKGWSIRRCAIETVALLEELLTTPAHVVGISMGGTIAQQIALDSPQMVGKLVLVNTFAILRPVTFSGWFYFLQRLILVHTLGLSSQARFVARRIFPRPEQDEIRQILIESITSADPRAYRAAMRALGLFNSMGRLVEIKAPTLVVTSENDTTVPPVHQQLLVEGIPGAQQVIIPGAGHAVSVDSPEVFNRELLEFLK